MKLDTDVIQVKLSPRAARVFRGGRSIYRNHNRESAIDIAKLAAGHRGVNHVWITADYQFRRRFAVLERRTLAQESRPPP